MRTWNRPSSISGRKRWTTRSGLSKSASGTSSIRSNLVVQVDGTGAQPFPSSLGTLALVPDGGVIAVGFDDDGALPIVSAPQQVVAEGRFPDVADLAVQRDGVAPGEVEVFFRHHRKIHVHDDQVAATNSPCRTGRTLVPSSSPVRGEPGDRVAERSRSRSIHGRGSDSPRLQRRSL